MPIDITPHPQLPVIHYTFAGYLAPHDLEYMAQIEAPYFQGCEPGSLSALLDFSQLDTIPADLFGPLQRARVIRDARVDRVAVIGANSYLRALMISLGVVTGEKRFLFCRTLDEALARLGFDAQAAAAD